MLQNLVRKIKISNIKLKFSLFIVRMLKKSHTSSGSRATYLKRVIVIVGKLVIAVAIFSVG